MKKLFVLVVAMLVAFAPMSFAAKVCDMADSSGYLNAAAGKLCRGLSNAAFGWVELVRQPYIQANKWEGVSKGVGYTIGRTLSGAVEAATFFVPGAKIPLPPAPICGIDLLGGGASK